jgi:hypothetical protein
MRYGPVVISLAFLLALSSPSYALPRPCYAALSHGSYGTLKPCGCFAQGYFFNSMVDTTSPN